MRTTVELPPTLMRAAKARAAERGESLKALLARAVAADLDVAPEAGQRRDRVRLPLFGSTSADSVNVTSEDLARALAEADAAAVVLPERGRARPSPRRRR